MALVTCPECGRKVSERADACPNCGYPICASLQKSKQEAAQKDFDRGRNIIILVITRMHLSMFQ